MLRVLRPALPFAAMTLSRYALNSSFVPMDSRAGLSRIMHGRHNERIVQALPEAPVQYDVISKTKKAHVAE